MTKIRIPKEFGVAPNNLLNNKKLSFKAKGIYTYLQSKPDGWDFASERIQKDSTEGVSAISTGLKELEENGYLERRKHRNNKGQWEWEYVLHGKPTSNSPSTDNRGTDDAVTDNLSTNKERYIKKDKERKKEYSADAEKGSPVEDDIQLVEVDDNGEEITHDKWNNPIKKKKEHKETQDKKQKISELYWEYSGVKPKNKAERVHFRSVNNQFLKRLAKTYPLSDIERSMQYCEARFDDWSLSAVEKNILKARSEEDPRIASIVVTHAKFKGIDIDGKEDDFVRKHKDIAKKLLDYEPQEILTAHKYCEEKFPETWGLEAVVNNIDYALANKN